MPRESGRSSTLGPSVVTLTVFTGSSAFPDDDDREIEMPSANQIVFDRALLRRRQARARALGPEMFLIDRVAADLAERLGAVLRQFDVGIDLGAPADAVGRALADA